MKKPAILLLLLSAMTAKAQTGFFIYHDTVKGKPHIQINDIKEGSDKKLYIAGESKDENFELTSPWFMQVDGKGEMLHKSALSTEVSDIKRVILNKDQKSMLYGNTTSTGGKPQSYSALLTEEGHTTSINVMAMSYAMILGDAVPYSKTQTLVVQSNRNKETQLYNLNLIKAANDMYFPSGFATIESTYNEISTQVVTNRKKDIFIVGFRMIGEDLQPFVYATDSTGKKLWEAIPEIPAGFENLKIGLDKNENILVTAGYRNNNLGNCNTQLWKANASGKTIQQLDIPNLKSNGILLLKNGNVMIYGADFQIHDRRFIISKGSFVVLDDKFAIVKQDEMKKTDAPDADLAPLAMSAKPTSSEFNTGIQLSDGRIVLGGRITFPEFPEDEKILGCTYYNEACLLFLNEKASFRKGE